MKKRIAAILAILMLAGTMTACTKSEAATPKPTASSETAKQTAVSAATEPTTQRATEITTKAAEKPKKEKPKKKITVKTQPTSEPRETAPAVKVKAKAVTKSCAVKVTQPATEKPAQKATQKPTQKPKAKSTPKPKTTAPKPKAEPKPKSEPKPKPTKPAPKKQTVDISRVVSAGISYGKGRGMKYDSSLTTGNSSYFPPTDGSIYDSTDELISAVKGDISYLIDSFSGDCKPGDISFNVIAKGKAVYIVYC